MINTKELTEEAKEIAFNELNRLKSMGQRTAEYDSVINYLEILLSLPWGTLTKDHNNLQKCEVIIHFFIKIF